MCIRDRPIDVHQLYVDNVVVTVTVYDVHYKQAYDSLKRKYLLLIVGDFGLFKKLINLTKMTTA